MIAINPDEGGIVFRDLFSWEDSESQFLKDVASGEINFLFSKAHEKTSRFKEGKNPSIFAAVRYLAKLAQYEVEGASGDLDLIKKIVDETNWQKVKNNSYVKHKLEEFGKKVLLNAPDSEYAWNLLENVGLRERLIEMDGNQTQEETLSWWMNKEPLRSKPVGEGDGRTATDIFNRIGRKKIIVAHETNSFHAYENITRSSKGKANAFISRGGVSGEAAVYGDGFYTQIGTEGARGTNLTIRFKLNPKAREGTDFIYNDKFVIIKNKSALTLIQENLNISIVDYLKLLSSGEIKASDKGLVEKFNRKFGRVDTKSKEFKEGVEYVKSSYRLFPEVSVDFKKMDFSSFEELVKENERKRHFIGQVFSSVDWSEVNDKHRNILKTLIDVGNIAVRKEIVIKVLSFEGWESLPESGELLQNLIDKGGVEQEIVRFIVSNQYWKKHPEVERFIISKGSDDKVGHSIALYGLARGEWNTHPRLKEILLALIKEGRSNYGVPEQVFKFLKSHSWTGYNNSFEFFKEVIKYPNTVTRAVRMLSEEYWAAHPKIGWMMEVLIKRKNTEGDVAATLTGPHWAKYPQAADWIEAIIEKNTAYGNQQLIVFILAKEHWAVHPKAVDWLWALVRSNRVNSFIARHVLSKPYWANHKNGYEFVKYMINNTDSEAWVAQSVLSQEYWVQHRNSFELLSYLILKKSTKAYSQGSGYSIGNFLRKKVWQNHPELKAFMRGKKINLKNLKERYKKIDFQRWLSKHRLKSKLSCSSDLL